MQAWFIFIPSSAATAAVPPSLPAVCGSFITSPTGRFSPVTVAHTDTHTHMHTHPHSLQDRQPVESPQQQSYPTSPCSPTWALGTVEGGREYYGNTIACCSLPLSCSTAGKDHHYKYCSNLFRRDTLERLGDRERMSAAYIDHIKYD